MNNKDLIEKKLLGTDTEDGITCEIWGYRKNGVCYVEDVINKRTEDCKHLSTTTESKEADGEEGNAITTVKGKSPRMTDEEYRRRNGIQEADGECEPSYYKDENGDIIIPSKDFPKTNNNKIDEVIESYQKQIDECTKAGVSGMNLPNLMERFIELLQLLKSSPTNTDERECNLCPECGEHYRACGCAVQSQANLEKKSESGEVESN